MKRKKHTTPKQSRKKGMKRKVAGCNGDFLENVESNNKMDSAEVNNNGMNRRMDKLAFIVATNPSISNRQAGLKAGYSDSYVSTGGVRRLLERGDIQEAIEQYKKKYTKPHNVTVDRVLAEESCIAFLNPQDLFNPFGDVKPIHELPEHVARAIQSIQVKEKVDKHGNVRTTFIYKLHDKGRSLERLSKYLQMYSDGNTTNNLLILQPDNINKPAHSGTTLDATVA